MKFINKNIKILTSRLLIFSYFLLLVGSALHYHNLNIENQFNSVYKNETHHALNQNTDFCTLCHFNSSFYDITSSIIINSKFSPQFYFSQEYKQPLHLNKTSIDLRGPPSLHS
jgi:hypothetical protein